MIEGQVSPFLAAYVKLAVYRKDGRTMKIQALIDTGYDGFLALPLPIIETLELDWDRNVNATLADGTSASFGVYRGDVDWDGERITVYIDAAVPMPMIGMGMMQGYDIHIRNQVGGPVRMTRVGVVSDSG
jgi:clan AA aspartic protease